MVKDHTFALFIFWTLPQRSCSYFSSLLPAGHHEHGEDSPPPPGVQVLAQVLCTPGHPCPHLATDQDTWDSPLLALLPKGENTSVSL